MTSLERAGFNPTGEYQQLNSYENRVFDVAIEGQDRVVAKFYRPGRWSAAALEEEHSFLHDLVAEGLPAVAPLTQASGATLSQHEGLWLAVFPKQRGRMPQEFLNGELRSVGRSLALLHRVGGLKPFRHRHVISSEALGWPALEDLQNWIAPEMRTRYNEAAAAILEHLDGVLDPNEFRRIHGDAHRGNLLHNGEVFYFVDFDDCATGPRAQDVWMLTQGAAEERQELLDELLAGYEELMEWDPEEEELMEPLRGLRIISYGAWIARRWQDPSFPRIFPDFTEYTYWAEETEALERIAWDLP